MGFVNSSYQKKQNKRLADKMKEGIAHAAAEISEANTSTAEIEGFSKRQNVFVLNASVEAARAGDTGKGFAMVATEMQKLAKHMAVIYKAVDKEKCLGRTTWALDMVVRNYICKAQVVLLFCTHACADGNLRFCKGYKIL